MNLGIFTGNIGAAPSKNQTNSGEAVLNFSLGCAVGTKAAPRTLWLDCSMYGKRADILSQYLEKGTKVTVSGRLDQVEFKKKDGSQDKKLTLNVSEIDMHGSPSGNAAQTAPAAAPKSSSIDDMMDDIPF